MNFLGHGTEKFAPAPGDSIRELRWKAESMLEYLQENEAFLRKFPTGAMDARRAQWQPLAAFLARAMEQPELADDARLEAQRVWAEESHHSALVTITMCVHARSDTAQKCFADNPEQLDELIESLERARPAALEVISVEELNALRRDGFLRDGE